MSKWYDKTVKEIGQHKDILSKKETKKYQLELLGRVARRADSFSTACGECQLFQQEISSLTTELSMLIQMPNKQGTKRYSKTLNGVVKHLQKEHKLVSEGYYAQIGIGIGLSIGTGLGAALDNPGVGTGIGTALGITIGSYLDRKAKKEDRLIKYNINTQAKT